jgi:1-acyl-sn-glycerol-3-phosphate acyltransferase
VKAPVPGPSVPTRNNPVSAAFGRLGLSLFGWRIEGEFPDVPKCVVIVAPHTSNWDFFVGLCAGWALDIRFSFIAKQSLFWFPLGVVLRWLGGIPVDRSAAHGIVGRIVALYRERPQLFLAVTPEGTRRRVEEWKTGFYRIAEGAGVPIVPVVFDYGRRAVAILAPFTATGDLEADVGRIRSLYAGVRPRRPGNWVPG